MELTFVVLWTYLQTSFCNRFQEWILTAAHCFCLKGMKCIPGKGTKTHPSKLGYSLKHISIFVGQHDITLKSAKKGSQKHHF